MQAAARHVHDPAADFIALRIGTRQMASDHLRYRTEDPADQPRQTEASRATAQDRQEVFIGKILQVHELRDCRQKDRTIVTAGRACCGQRTRCWPGTTSPGSPHEACTGAGARQNRLREMAAECIKTIKLRMRACLSGRAAGQNSQAFCTGCEAASGRPAKAQLGTRRRRRAPRIRRHLRCRGTTRRASKERLKTRRRDPDGVRSRSQA